MKYIHFSVQDFVSDAFFQKWVVSPDAETISFWENWQQQHPYKKPELEEAKNIIKTLGFSTNFDDNTAFIDVWSKIQTEREELAQPVIKEPLKIPVALSFNTFQKVAAVFIGLALVSFAWFFLANNEKPVTQYSTNFGEVKNVQLPDGSVVMLNSNSVLSYNSDWDNEEPREVWLKGEAYFSVLKKQNAGNAKFKVHAKNLTVEVLGTRFNVNDRRNSTKVALESGKVKVRTNAPNIGVQELELQPGDYAEYVAGQKILTKKTVDIRFYTSWVSNKIILNKASLLDVANLLEDNYGLQIKFVNEELAFKKLTGNIPRDNYQLLLETLSKLYDIEIIQKDNQLLFSKTESKN